MNPPPRQLARTFPPSDLVRRVRALVAERGWGPAQRALGCTLETAQQLAGGGPVRADTLERIAARLTDGGR